MPWEYGKVGVDAKASQPFALRLVMPFEEVLLGAGHSVMRLNRMKDSTHDESSWYLLPYQLGQDFPKIITSHVRKGVDLAAEDSSSLLIFSGGQTRKDVGMYHHIYL